MYLLIVTYVLWDRSLDAEVSLCSSQGKIENQDQAACVYLREVQTSRMLFYAALPQVKLQTTTHILNDVSLLLRTQLLIK